MLKRHNYSNDAKSLVGTGILLVRLLFNFIICCRPLYYMHTEKYAVKTEDENFVGQLCKLMKWFVSLFSSMAEMMNSI